MRCMFRDGEVAGVSKSARSIEPEHDQLPALFPGRSVTLCLTVSIETLRSPPTKIGRVLRAAGQERDRGSLPVQAPMSAQFLQLRAVLRVRMHGSPSAAACPRDRSLVPERRNDTWQAGGFVEQRAASESVPCLPQALGGTPRSKILACASPAGFTPAPLLVSRSTIPPSMRRTHNSGKPASAAFPNSRSISCHYERRKQFLDHLIRPSPARLRLSTSFASPGVGSTSRGRADAHRRCPGALIRCPGVADRRGLPISANRAPRAIKSQLPPAEGQVSNAPSGWRSGSGQRTCLGKARVRCRPGIYMISSHHLSPACFKFRRAGSAVSSRLLAKGY